MEYRIRTKDCTIKVKDKGNGGVITIETIYGVVSINRNGGITNTGSSIDVEKSSNFMSNNNFAKRSYNFKQFATKYHNIEIEGESKSIKIKSHNTYINIDKNGNVVTKSGSNIGRNSININNGINANFLNMSGTIINSIKGKGSSINISQNSDDDDDCEININSGTENINYDDDDESFTSFCSSVNKKRKSKKGIAKFLYTLRIILFPILFLLCCVCVVACFLLCCVCVVAFIYCLFVIILSPILLPIYLAIPVGYKILAVSIVVVLFMLALL